MAEPTSAGGADASVIVGLRASSLRSTLRTVPLVVWSTTVAFGALLVFHSFLTPLAHAPDEYNHLDLALLIAADEPYPEHDGRYTSEGALAASYTFRPMFPLTPESAGAAPFDRSYADWGGDEPSPDLNQMPQHPPLYYELVGTEIRAVRKLRGGPSSLFREWHLARMLTLVLLFPLPILVWATARTLGASPAAQSAAPIGLLAIPQLAHIGASVNNDALLALLAACLALLLARVLVGGRRWSLHVLVGVVTGLALLTKAFAVVFPLWIAIVYGARIARDSSGRRRTILGLGVAAAVTVAIGAWWWVGNYLDHGTFAPTTQTELYGSALRRADFEPDPVWWAGRFVVMLPRRFFGEFGWLGGVPTALATVFLAYAVFGAGVLGSARRSREREAGTDRVRRTDLYALASVVVPLLVFVAVRAYGRYGQSGRLVFIQGRYLFSALVPIVVLVAVGLSRLVGRWAAPVLLATAAVLQVDAARVMLRDWWGEPNTSMGRSIDAMVAFSPVPTPVLGLVVGVIVSSFVAIGLLVARDRRAGGHDPGPSVGSSDRTIVAASAG